MADKKLPITGEELYAKCAKGSGFKSSCEPMLEMIKGLGNYISIAEIGVCKGIGMWKMLTECGNILHAYGIDTWWEYGNDSFDMGLSNLNIARQVLSVFDNVSLIIDRSVSAWKLFDSFSLDYVFVDGDHSYNGCYYDMGLWWSTVKKGGIMAGHDYNNGNPGVMKAVKQFEEDEGLTVEKTEGWVWYVRKT